MKRPASFAALVFTTIVAASLACSSSSSNNGPPSGSTHTPPQPPRWSADCDPIVPYHCGFPFPSNTQLVDDASTPTGKHVSFKQAVLPTHTGNPTDPAPWSDLDGFSVGMNIVTDLPFADPSKSNLPNETTLDLSITTNSPTILLDTSTGQLVPHIAEIDVRNKKDVTYDYWDQAFMLRPVVRLKNATRYIVAIRHVVDDKGAPLDASPEFKNLRDGKSSNEPSVEARRDLYKDIFAQLDKAGIKQNDLQIAWDFTTSSTQNTTKWLIAMRDDALKTVGDKGPAYTIDSVEENPCGPTGHVARRILGHMTVPLYLDQGGPKLPHHMNLGSDGMPKQNGTYDYPFEVQIPNSLTVAGAKPGPILQNGHGLLGSPGEGQCGYLAVDADTNGMVTIAVPLVGMAEEDNSAKFDTPVTAAVTGDIGLWKQIVDRQHQGLVNELLAMRMMMGAFKDDPKLQYNGHSVIDPTIRYYRGDSQGGIFGTTYMSITTDVTRGILGEPGAPYSMLLYRSEDFNPFFFTIGLQYADSLDVNIVLGLVQMLWDRTEPIGYVAYLNQNMLPGTPQHQVLLQVAIGDHQVTPLGAHVIARTIGAQNLKPVNRELFQIPDADSGFTGSGIVEFDFSLPFAMTNCTSTNKECDCPAYQPYCNEAMSVGPDPHDAVRVLPAVVQMENEFLRNGVVKNFCGGACKGTF